MAKEIVAHIKLQIPAGQANPAPPVGTALGPRGVNIMAFCKEFNAATQKQAGDILPVVITVFKDKSSTFITKSPPAAVPLKKAANIAAGSKEPNKEKVGKGTRKQIMDIVKTKSTELNASSDELLKIHRFWGWAISFSRTKREFSQRREDLIFSSKTPSPSGDMKWRFSLVRPTKLTSFGRLNTGTSRRSDIRSTSTPP